MNILLYDMTSYIQQDMIYYLQKMGHHCKNVMYRLENKEYDCFFEYKFKKILNEGSYDCVISTNFIRILARICYESNIKYISWTYDSPIDYSKIEYYQYPTSYIFLFDRNDVEKISAIGGVNIFHCPLAVNTDRLDKINLTQKDYDYYNSDISFVGTFYENEYPTIRYCIEDYDKGYLDSIIQTQLQLYGCNIIETMVDENLLLRINKSLLQHTTTQLTSQQMNFCLAREVTRIERTTLCHILGLEHKLNYYSDTQLSDKKHINWMGTAHYFSEMPKIFKASTLNLNPTIKSIQTGIPLRALDIIGCKSVLFSNYQPELAEYFTDGQDVIMYDCIEDAIAKADFYLSRADLLQDIAQNGYNIVKEHFNYTNKLSLILKTAGL